MRSLIEAFELRNDTIRALKDCTDIQLADRIAARDAAALEVMMRRNNQTLYRAARSILRNEEEAEEAVQDAYLKAYRSITKYQGGSALSTWLTRIVINEALARRRKFQRRADLIQINSQFAHAPERD